MSKKMRSDLRVPLTERFAYRSKWYNKSQAEAIFMSAAMYLGATDEMINRWYDEIIKNQK
ncbi:MAG: hypothetical protein ABSH16_06835 [Sedimentisphaerales bacterium]